MRTVSIALLILAMCTSAFAGEDPADAVRSYHRALESADAEALRSAIAPTLFMFGGNFSDDTRKWQPHLYLEGETLQRWIDGFLKNAGPHRNEVEIESSSVRRDSAIVVATETGRNRFREWRDQRVTYLVGKSGGRWKVAGFFIRDESNPD
jgi:hypothetical protein